MTNKEKAQLLIKRHIPIVIEWGGTDEFVHASNMTQEGIAEFLEIMALKNEEEINYRLTELVQKEDDKQN
jgi:hypothetical protein